MAEEFSNTFSFNNLKLSLSHHEKETFKGFWHLWIGDGYASLGFGTGF